VLRMDTGAKPRRCHWVEGETISGLARKLSLSRKTINEYLRQTEPSASRRREPSKPKLGVDEERPERRLEQDAQRPRRQRRSGCSKIYRRRAMRAPVVFSERAERWYGPPGPEVSLQL